LHISTKQKHNTINYNPDIDFQINQQKVENETKQMNIDKAYEEDQDG